MTNEKGTGLIEVLLATFLITLTLLFVATLCLAGFRTLDRSGEAAAALVLTQQRIEWLRNHSYTSATLTAGTTVDQLTGTYAGYVRTTTIEDDSPRAGVKKVTVTITAPSGSSAQTVAVIAKI